MLISYKAVLLTGVGSTVQLITVIVIFLVVLALTYLTTRFVGGYQKNKNLAGNIQILEAIRITNSKLIEIVSVGDKCFAIAVCKDTVTLLGEIDRNSLKEKELPSSGYESFEALFDKFKHKDDINKNTNDQEDR